MQEEDGIMRSIEILSPKQFECPNCNFERSKYKAFRRLKPGLAFKYSDTKEIQEDEESINKVNNRNGIMVNVGVLHTIKVDTER